MAFAAAEACFLAIAPCARAESGKGGGGRCQADAGLPDVPSSWNERFNCLFRVARAENERRTFLIMSSRETSMPSGPVAPMVNPPKGKPLKAIFEATLGGRARENARMRRVGKGKDEKKSERFVARNERPPHLKALPNLARFSTRTVP